MGSCTLQRDKYDVDGEGGEDASSVDERKKDMTSTMSIRMAVWMPVARTIANKIWREY